jgi:hypothetical protein
LRDRAWSATLSTMPDEPPAPQALRIPIDHLVLGAPEVEAGMAHAEALLGARPVPGGRHPAYGTRNALLSLGPSTYLEVLAPDPELPAPGRGRLFDLASMVAPRLVTWVARREGLGGVPAPDLERLGLGPVGTGRRETADGGVLSWRLTDPYALPFDGAVPFLIDWGGTVHPATTAPSGGLLSGLRIEHPRAPRVREVLIQVTRPDPSGVPVEIVSAGAFRLVATVETSNGVVELG